MPSQRETMPPPDFDAARRYALDRLERELSPSLRYHSLEHTRDDVVPAAERLAQMEGVTGEPLRLLLTAAYFHDTGYVLTRDEHEAASIGIAREALPHYGFNPAQVDEVTDIILTTRLPQSPRNSLDAVLADADLDVLGRDDYWTRNLDLRAEWELFGRLSTDEAWYENQMNFQKGHHYFTASARRLRDAKKKEIIARLEAMLEKMRRGTPWAADGG